MGGVRHFHLACLQYVTLSNALNISVLLLHTSVRIYYLLRLYPFVCRITFENNELKSEGFAGESAVGGSQPAPGRPQRRLPDRRVRRSTCGCHDSFFLRLRPLIL